MVKKLHKFLALLLALALVITTFGSDFANAKVFASDDEVVEVAPSTEAMFEAIPDGESAAEVAASTESSESTEEAVEETEETAEESETSETEEISDASAEGTGSQTDEVKEEEESKEDETQVEDEEKKEEEAAEDEIAADASTEATSEAATEATTEDETEKKDEEKKAAEKEEVVEKEFNQSTTIDDIKISLYAEPGVLPADAVLNVEKVADSKESEIKELIDEELGEEKEVQVTYSYDINIYSESEGRNVQPEDGTVEVRFEEIDAAESEETALAVFHVEDDLSDADKVASAGTDATEISFDAEHFSIYTVTVYKKHSSYKADELDVYLVDVNYNEIGRLQGAFSIEVDSYDDVISADTISQQLTIPDGYQLLALSATNYNYAHNIIKEFKLQNNYGWVDDSVLYRVDGGNWNYLPSSWGTSYIFAVCRKVDQQTTANHLDLGFEYEDFKNYYNNAQVFAIVDGAEHRMTVNPEVYIDSFDGKKYYEFRYESRIPIKSSSNISFKVVTGGKTYRMDCTQEDNIAAFERCFMAHSNSQSQFGFDYISTFTQDFNLEGGVEYVKNDGSNKVKSVALSWTSQDADEKAIHNALTYDETELGSYQGHEFVEWNTQADGNGKTVEPGSEVEVANKQTVKIYAIWKIKVENFKVAVYATDGTNSQDITGKVQINEKLANKLNLDYVQQDGYYPIGVVELPSSMFEGSSPYINDASDVEKVKAAISAIDTSNNKSGRNSGNTVANNLSFVQVDVNQTAGSFNTAMFDWNTAEYDGSIVNPDGENFAYHLDLRFKTNIVEYNAVYFTGDKKDSTEYLGEQAFFSGEALSKADAEEYVKDNDTDYDYVGLYTDPDCTKGNEFTGIESLDEDTVLYARFEVPQTQELWYFLLQDGRGEPDRGPQPDSHYNPSGEKIWPGTAKNIDLLTPTYQKGIYKEIFNWTGIDRESIQYQFNDGTLGLIQNFLDTKYNKNITDEDAKFTTDDIIWYVYKRQVDGHHIDGYVSANVTYDANNGGADEEGNTTFADAKTRVNTSVEVKENMFTVSDLEFVGWNTKADGTGVSYEAKDALVVNAKNIVLYAQWRQPTNKYAVNFFFQREDGTYDYQNPEVTEVYEIEVPSDYKKYVYVKATGEDPENKLGAFYYRVNEEKTVTTYSNNCLVVKDGKGIAYELDKSPSENWDDLKLYRGTKFEDAQINVYLKRISDKYKLRIQVDAEGDDKDQYHIYDGDKHHADVNVKVSAKSLDSSLFSRAIEAVENAIRTIRSFGVLTVYAADETYVDKPVDPFSTTVGGINITVDGMKTRAIEGVDFGDYPVTLDYSDMTITTKIDGETVNVRDLFEVEVDTNGVAQTTTTEAEDKEEATIAYLHITKRTVVLRSASDSKEYDGTALRNSNVTVSGDGFANGANGTEGVKNNVTGSQTEIGSSKNSFTYTAFSNTNLAKNYIISKSEGTLTVYGGGDNPPPTDTPPTDTPPTEDAPPVGTVLGATRGEVLGATREPAVLGARRGRTEDNTNTLAHILTILVAAGVAFAMIALRKKNEDEK